MWYVIYDGGKVPFANRSGAEVYADLLRAQGKDAFAMLLDEGEAEPVVEPRAQSAPTSS